MTREEAIRIIRKMLACTDLSVRANLNADMVDACHLAIQALEQEPTYISELTQKAYEDGKKDGYVQAKIEQTPVLDKVRAEANKECISDGFGRYIRFDVLDRIINKYTAESEEV